MPSRSRAPVRLEVTPPISWGAVVTSLVLGAASLAFGAHRVWAGSAASSGLVFVALAVALLVLAARMARPTPRATVDRDGIQHARGRAELTSVVHFRAERVRFRPDRVVTRYVARLADDSQLIFSDLMPGAASVAASLQARRFDPTGELDLEAALLAGSRPRPAEALGISDARLERFYGNVREAAEDVELTLRVDRDNLRALEPDGRVYELYGLARKCVRKPDTAWRRLAREHFASVSKVRAEAEAALTAGLEATRPRLRIQLHRASEATRRLVGQAVGDDFRAVVVIDTRWGDAALTREDLARLRATEAEVLTAARLGLATSAPEQREEPGGMIVFAGDAYTAAHLLRLPELVELDEDLGAIVAAPSQSLLLVVPVREISTLLQLDVRHAALVERLWSEAERPLARGLWWWRAGTLEPFEAVPTVDGVTFRVPDDLSRRLTARALRA